MSRGLRFSVLLGVLLLLLVAAASASSSSSSRPPEVYSVVSHETAGRSAPVPALLGSDGTQTLSEWAMTQRFYVGDVLAFKLASNDSLLLVRQADYERCSAASPVRRLAGGGGGDTRFTLARPGVFYFISATPARCEAGERMVVRVVEHPLNSGDAPTPAPAGPKRAVRRRIPLTLAQKQMVAGALGFAAGFVTMFLVVGIFICCCP